MAAAESSSSSSSSSGGGTTPGIGSLLSSLLRPGSGSSEQYENVASNVGDQIPQLQKLLQFTPIAKNVSIPAGTKPLVAGYLFVEDHHHKWHKRWCEYAGGIFVFKKAEKDEQPLGDVNVSYCVAEINRKDDIPKQDPKDVTVAPNKQQDFTDMYLSFLESQEAFHCFNLFSPERIHMFRADSGDERDRFVNAILTDLQKSFEPDIWSAKAAAAKELEPLLREQFMLQVHQYQAMIKSLSTAGYVDTFFPITSPKKDKSGILGLRQKADNDWKDFYFVLFEGALYYYKGSKSESPTGFVILRFCTIELDHHSLQKGQNVFIIHTPLRSLTLKTKHEVALAEWITTLERVIHASAGLEGKHKRRDSTFLLKEIARLRADDSLRLQDVLSHDLAKKVFIDFLQTEEKCLEELDFMEEVTIYKTKDVDRPKLAKDIVDRFLTKDSDDYLVNIIPASADNNIEAMFKELSAPSADLFDPILKQVSTSLDSRFAKFTASEKYEQLSVFFGTAKHENKKMPDREVPDFPDKYDLQVVVTAKEKAGTSASGKKPVIFKLDSKKAITIGRDHSNDICIDDARISRSHARLEYDGKKCEYLDLGSSHGSRVNGHKVLKIRITAGDTVVIGDSTLTFELQKRSFFSF